MKCCKAQASFEYLLILSLFLAILGVVVFYSSNQIISYITFNEVGSSAKSVARAANLVSAGGPGTMKVIAVELPTQIKEAYTSLHEIMYISSDHQGDSHMHYRTFSPVFGVFEVGSGKKHIIAKTEDNLHVSLTPLGTPDIFKGLIAFYNFDISNETHVMDVSGRTPPGELKGGVTCNEKGYIGRGCVFDGDDGRIEIENNKFLYQDITISMWINSRSWKDETAKALITSRTTTNDGLMFFINSSLDNKTYFDWDNNRWNTDYIPPNYEWTFLVITRNSTGKYFYANGILINSTTNIGSTPTSETKLVIGADSISNRYNFNGTIDEVMIWDRALTPFEIERLYLYGRSLE